MSSCRDCRRLHSFRNIIFFESHQHISHDIAEYCKKQIRHIAKIIEPSWGTAISVCIQHGDFSSFFIQDRCCRFLLGKTGFQICPHCIQAALKLLIHIICRIRSGHLGHRNTFAVYHTALIKILRNHHDVLYISVKKLFLKLLPVILQHGHVMRTFKPFYQSFCKWSVVFIHHSDLYFFAFIAGISFLTGRCLKCHCHSEKNAQIQEDQTCIFFHDPHIAFKYCHNVPS